MQFTILSHRALLRISGEDAYDFLQALVTNDMRRLDEKGILYAALLTPQGKFLHDFFLISQDGAVYMDIAASRAEDMRKRLQLYRLRSKVVIESLPESHGVMALWGDAAAALPFPMQRDPREKALGFRAIGLKADMLQLIRSSAHASSLEEAMEDAYEHFRLSLAIPDGSQDMTVEKSFLLPFGFDYLHGVDFTKGCYVGQEVTARMKHLGQAKKFLYAVSLLSGQFPEKGSEIRLGGEIAGELCSHRGDKGLAMLKVEAAEQSSVLELMCGEARLQATLPKWAISAKM